MTTVNMFGNKVYNNLEFKQHINSFYYPLGNMETSVARLKAATAEGIIDIKTMEYGDYQPILSPPYEWPKGVGKVWKAAVGLAKASLDGQPSNEALSPDEPNNKPATKGARLNDAIRKCFNSSPPIPMLIDVKERPMGDPDANKHGIDLYWEYKDENNKNVPPVLLIFTMICPYKS